MSKMAAMNESGLFQFAISLAIFALVVPFTRSQLIENNLLVDSQSCESICVATYSEKVTDLKNCNKGCRLMTIIDFMEELATPDELFSDCEKSCVDSYQIKDNACSFGCRSQLPATENRRKRIKALYDEEAPLLIPVHIYFGRMMDCMIDHVRHEMTMAMMFLSMSDQPGQVMVIHAQQIGGISPEYKTSNYMETNLVLAGSAATPDVKRSQIMAASSEVDLTATDVRRAANADSYWLTCFATKMGMSRMSLLFVLLIFIIGILWLCISSLTTSTKPSDIPPQKLSIYGDADYLLPLDETMQFSYVKRQESSAMAPALPIKILIQEI